VLQWAAMRKGRPGVPESLVSAAAGAVAALRDGGSRRAALVRLRASLGGGGAASFAGTPCARESGASVDAGDEAVNVRPAAGDAGPEGS
jgi:hypothetical protein